MGVRKKRASSVFRDTWMPNVKEDNKAVTRLRTRSSLGFERPVYKDELKAGVQFAPEIGHLLFEKDA